MQHLKSLIIIIYSTELLLRFVTLLRLNTETNQIFLSFIALNFWNTESKSSEIKRSFSCKLSFCYSSFDSKMVFSEKISRHHKLFSCHQTGQAPFWETYFENRVKSPSWIAYTDLGLISATEGALTVVLAVVLWPLKFENFRIRIIFGRFVWAELCSWQVFKVYQIVMNGQNQVIIISSECSVIFWWKKLRKYKIIMKKLNYSLGILKWFWPLSHKKNAAKTDQLKIFDDQRIENAFCC